MNEIIFLTIIALCSLCSMVLLIGNWVSNRRGAGSDYGPKFDGLERATERGEQVVRDEIKSARDEAAQAARALREEVVASVRGLSGGVTDQLGEHAGRQSIRLDTFAAALAGFRDGVERKLSASAADSSLSHIQNRDELHRNLKSFGDTLLARLDALTRSSEQRMDTLRDTVDNRLTLLQSDNTAKLEQMRATVDEKLHAALEQRLGESFKIVSERLEQVHKGLGEMQSLASGVGDLKKVLTNIKSRGTWGEVQLGNLLQQTLTAEQFEANVKVNPASGERVEYAIRLPGQGETDAPLWLPIDAKFPQEDYQRLVDAADRGDADGISASASALQARICAEAKKIKDKYICAPHTTDFAILFLPTEGLHAELLRRPGLCEQLQLEHRVMLAGPTTLAAILSSLSMGFRTLTIQKRSSEAWEVLSAVKTQFGKFGELLDKVQIKLEQATKTIEDAKQSGRSVMRKMASVETMPTDRAARLLPMNTLLQLDDTPDA